MIECWYDNSQCKKDEYRTIFINWDVNWMRQCEEISDVRSRGADVYNTLQEIRFFCSELNAVRKIHINRPTSAVYILAVVIFFQLC